MFLFTLKQSWAVSTKSDITALIVHIQKTGSNVIIVNKHIIIYSHNCIYIQF